MKKIFIAFIGMALAIPSVFAATWYVSPDGNDGNSGASWALAKKTIQAGADAANGGDTVLVANGTYVLTNRVVISSAITVKSVNGASSTTVNGNYPATINPCFNLSDLGAILDGFTITGGRDGFYSGGVWNNGTVKNCAISGNAGYRGGGVYNNGLVQNCAIFGNTASFYGGGVWNNGLLQNCVMSGNISASGGGGVWNVGIIENCTVSGNSSASAGGIFNYQGYVRNCIMYYNQNGDFSDQAGSYIPQYCCSPGLSGTGDITGDPQFVDPGAGNYRLQAASPCVNAGINQGWMTSALDLDSNPRIMDGRIDMGAYECTTPRTVIGPVIKANGLTFNASVNHLSNLSITVQLNPGEYIGTEVDWWAAVHAGSSWYYLNSAMQWIEDVNLLNWRPAYQGPLFNLPAAEILRITGVQTGIYTFYFAVDYPMDGILNLDGPIWVDSVNVAVQ